LSVLVLVREKKEKKRKKRRTIRSGKNGVFLDYILQKEKRKKRRTRRSRENNVHGYILNADTNSHKKKTMCVFVLISAKKKSLTGGLFPHQIIYYLQYR